eukprot:65397-Chlamydomonas_euryale.AAC.2
MRSSRSSASSKRCDEAFEFRRNDIGTFKVWVTVGGMVRRCMALRGRGMHGVMHAAMDRSSVQSGKLHKNLS